MAPRLKKTCTKCGINKPFSEFHICNRSKSGLQPKCKKCRSEYKQEPVAKKARAQRYREKNRKRINERNRKYRERNKDTLKKYREENKEKIAASKRKRRAMLINAEVKSYKNTEIFSRDNWICQLCFTKIDRRTKYPHPRSASIDHIIRLVDGGGDIPTNVQCSHFLCNVKKSNKSGGQLLLL